MHMDLDMQSVMELRHGREEYLDLLFGPFSKCYSILLTCHSELLADHHERPV